MSEKFFLYLLCVICSVTMVFCYKELGIRKKKISITYIAIISVLISSYLTLLTSETIFNAFKLIVNSIIFIFLNYIIFKEDMKTTTFKTIGIYMIMILVEIFLTIFTYFLNINSIQEYNEIYIFRILLSILIMLVSHLIFKITIFKNAILKVLNAIIKSKSKIFYISIILLYLVCIILAFRNALIRSKTDYIINVVLIVSFFLFILLVFYQSYKTKEAEKKEEILLAFMKKYESLIEKDRIRRHEILNNLLILKTTYNKKNFDFKELLDNIILQYQNKEKSNYSQIYKMPSGLKGILYYKLSDMDNLHINVNLNISKKVIKQLDNMEQNMFFEISKILGILLDNAIEAADKTKEKEIIIDFYKKENYSIIYIENSCENKINVSKIHLKGYSSKGKNRGYGLYIVNKVLHNNSKIDLKQHYNNRRFISELIIK